MLMEFRLGSCPMNTRMQIVFVAVVLIVGAFFAYIGFLDGTTGRGQAVSLVGGVIAMGIIWVWLNRRNLPGAFMRGMRVKPPPADWSETWKRIQKERGQ